MNFRTKKTTQKNKYHNKKIKINGIPFDSQVEGCRYVQLVEQLNQGLISNLKNQVPYELVPPMYKEEVVHMKTKDKIVKKLVQRPTIYKADFVYEKNGKLIVEDVKGSTQMITQEFKLKQKLMKYMFNIDVQVVIIPPKEVRRIMRNLLLSCSLNRPSSDQT